VSRFRVYSSARIRPYAFTVKLPPGAGDCFRVRR
jgi:hypothetical protein